MFPFWNWNNIIINYCHYNFLNLSLMLFWVTSLNPTSTSHMHTHTTTFNTICHIGEHVASSFTTSKLTLFGIRIEKPSNNLILTRTGICIVWTTVYNIKLMHKFVKMISMNCKTCIPFISHRSPVYPNIQLQVSLATHIPLMQDGLHITVCRLVVYNIIMHYN